MKIQLTLIVLLSVLSTVVKSQELSVKEMTEKAEIFFYEQKYVEANELFAKLLDKDSTNYILNFKSGYCLMQNKDTRFFALDKFKNAIRLFDKNKNKPITKYTLYSYLGKTYHKNYLFDEAISAYKKAKSLTNKENEIAETNLNIKIAKQAKMLFFNQKGMYVKRLRIINSNYIDHSPIINADGSTLVFTSTRKGSTGGLKTNSGSYYEDIYICKKNKYGRFTKPVNIGAPVNTPGHEATCGLSADGQEMFMYKSDGRNGGNIFYSKLQGRKWTKPVKLGENINTKYRETHATISADGKFLYFTSNRKGGFGGTDIYVSEKQKDGTWGTATNLGANINTNKDEEGPYIHPDGETLYFSSNGRIGMGGFDVFYSKKNNNVWTTPINMGAPLNTVDNDVFFVPTADGKTAFYSSDGKGGSDIYIANFYDVKQNALAIVKGIIKDELPKITQSTIINIPQNVKISVIDSENGDIENSYTSNSATGDYLFVLNQRKKYKILYEADKHIFDTKDIILKDDNKFKSIVYNAELDSVIHGKVKKSKKVGFRKGFTTLNNFTKLELKFIAKCLKKYPELALNITGYDYLLEKSNRNFFRLEYEFAKYRRQRMVDYLQNLGVDTTRIYADVFRSKIIGDSLEYTIFSKEFLTEEVTKKEKLEKEFKEVEKVANLTEKEIVKIYPDEVIADIKPIFVKEISFRINQYQTSKYNKNLKLLAKFLTENPKSKIELGGYTDEQGPNDYNKKLSEKRANFIKTKLIKYGAKEAQITTKGYAFENPIAFNRTKEGKFYWKSLKYNRRVEIKVKIQGENQHLSVIKIKVPENYKINRVKVVKSIKYSISLVVSDTKIEIASFKDVDDVQQKITPNGMYMYYYGEFNDDDEVLDVLTKIRSKYPKAFIFIKK